MKLSQTLLASIALFSIANSAIITQIEKKIVTVVLNPVVVTVQPGEQPAPATTPAPAPAPPTTTAAPPAPAPTTSSYTTRNRRKPWAFTTTINGNEVVYNSYVSTITPTQPAPAPAPTTSTQPPAPAPPAPTTTTQPPAPSPTAQSTTVAAQKASSTEPELTTPTTSSVSNNDFGDVQDVNFSQQILDAHNQKRALHGVSPLTWEQAAYDYAQAYADKYDCSGNLVHSGGPYGENLALGYNDGPSAVNAWYNEGTNYDYGSETDYDHFTAIIWKSTTKLGCAYKDCSAENWGKYIICSYDPAGNVLGEMSANVLPPVN
ncbi:hypothetical protein JA1_000429 [Spathaspora sp. JA1]|nr:hypothetical protein JA1_000429 [Spathaspora sp. JA1]